MEKSEAVLPRGLDHPVERLIGRPARKTNRARQPVLPGGGLCRVVRPCNAPRHDPAITGRKVKETRVSTGQTTTEDFPYPSWRKPQTLTRNFAKGEVLTFKIETGVERPPVVRASVPVAVPCVPPPGLFFFNVRVPCGGAARRYAGPDPGVGFPALLLLVDALIALIDGELARGNGEGEDEHGGSIHLVEPSVLP